MLPRASQPSLPFRIIITAAAQQATYLNNIFNPNSFTVEKVITAEMSLVAEHIFAGAGKSPTKIIITTKRLCKIITIYSRGFVSAVELCAHPQCRQTTNPSLVQSTHRYNVATETHLK